MLQTESITRPVKVLDIVPGPPPAILTYERLRLQGGGTKPFMQQVPVLDDVLSLRLLREVAVGDEVRITVVTEWGQPGLPHYLADFTRKPVSQKHTEAPRR
jgi:hypothetical protein